MKINLLNRELLQGPYLALVLSEKEFYRAMRKFGVKKSRCANWLCHGAEATLHTLERDGNLACIVALDAPPWKHGYPDRRSSDA